MAAKHRQTCDVMRAAKACGPGTPGLVLSLARSRRRPYRARGAEFRKATVTNKVMDTGESTQISRRTIAQGMPMLGFTCSD
jgi:hypothetical protein